MKATFLQAIPQNCFFGGEARIILQVFMFDKVKQSMTDEEIIAGHKEQQPFLNQMREIICRRCHVIRCPHNFNFTPSGFIVFQELMKGQWMERIGKADRFLAELVSEEKKRLMEKSDISLSTSQMPSRKNPLLFIMLKRNGKHVRIRCEVGKRILIVEGKRETLTSVKQLRDKIDDAVSALS